MFSWLYFQESKISYGFCLPYVIFNKILKYFSGYGIVNHPIQDIH